MRCKLNDIHKVLIDFGCFFPNSFWLVALKIVFTKISSKALNQLQCQPEKVVNLISIRTCFFYVCLCAFFCSFIFFSNVFFFQLFFNSLNFKVTPEYRLYELLLCCMLCNKHCFEKDFFVVVADADAGARISNDLVTWCRSKYIPYVHSLIYTQKPNIK